ncbi:MAG: NTP transferase domain-containing protein [Actinobacteria bacterium]|nr:NTP transferase domain-containing protein [Actinomycetota bacterium]MCI0544326.1 NTP transferase domain-containing protein [Actinomycetota bacterium]
MSVIRPVILSGGSGTRLWPLSTPSRPKQFADLIPGGPTLFEATLKRLEGDAPIVVTGADHLGLVEESLAKLGKTPHLVVVEPAGRNTAPAVAAAALVSAPDDVLVILPADHLIEDVTGFRAAVNSAVDLAVLGHVVTFGVRPTRPETGYGYLQAGEPLGAGHRVLRFQEKPTAEEVGGLMAGHLWNSGMFVIRAGTIVDEMTTHCPDLLEGVRSALGSVDEHLLRLAQSFTTVTPISFDHAVMEKTERAAMIPIDVGWDDIGSFASLMGHLPLDAEGNAVSGPVILDDVTGSLVHASDRRVVVSGASDLVVVETSEGVLVVPLSQAQRVRTLAERAQNPR